jgi:hypothetical protein
VMEAVGEEEVGMGYSPVGVLHLEKVERMLEVGGAVVGEQMGT